MDERPDDALPVEGLAADLAAEPADEPLLPMPQPAPFLSLEQYLAGWSLLIRGVLLVQVPTVETRKAHAELQAFVEASTALGIAAGLEVPVESLARDEGLDAVDRLTLLVLLHVATDPLGPGWIALPDLLRAVSLMTGASRRSVRERLEKRSRLRDLALIECDADQRPRERDHRLGRAARHPAGAPPDDDADRVAVALLVVAAVLGRPGVPSVQRHGAVLPAQLRQRIEETVFRLGDGAEALRRWARTSLRAGRCCCWTARRGPGRA